MKDFVNETNEGNEPAIRRGKAVPPNAVNLAWAKSPKFSPDKNISIVDFSMLIPENMRNENQRTKCKVMYANHLGILIDEHDNDIVHDEFPAVTDVFSIDEDFSTDVNIDTENNIFKVEYKAHHILPYLHVSRYFHVDNAGLTMPGSTISPPSNSLLKVVREDGTEYLDENGEKAYRIELVFVNLEFAEDESPIETDNKGLYRVNVYMDTEEAKGLFLQYFKAEYDSEGQRVKEYDINYRERLNPFKFFTYIPEEAELLDQSYARYKHYSTKPTGGKAQIYGGSATEDINGYRIHVPKRAIPDPRLYQLFRWRVRCEFLEIFVTEETEGGGWEAPTNPTNPTTPPPTAPAPVTPKIKVGVLMHVDGFLTSTAPMAFLNLGQSNANMHGIDFVNPLSDALGKSKYTKDYWAVDMGTTTQAQLAQFDVLIVAPWLKKWTLMNSWYAYLIESFVKSSGGTLIVDGGNDTYFTNSPFSQYTAPVMPSGNLYTSHGGTLSDAKGDSIFWSGYDGSHHPIIDGSSRLSGFNLRTTMGSGYVTKMTMRTQGYYGTTDLQYFGPNNISDIPGASWAAWRPILVAPINGSSGSGVTLAVTNGGGISNGSVVWTTLGFTEDVSRYFSSTGQVTLDAATYLPNKPTASQIQSAIASGINRSFSANSYKLLYNICLYAVRNKSVSLMQTSSGSLSTGGSSTGQPTGGGYEEPTVGTGEFSTTWTGYSPWFTSYVIDGEVLTEEERDELGFSLAPYAEDSTDVVWQRRLSTKTVEQIIDEELGPDIVGVLSGATRTYEIDVSNEAVKVPTTILFGSNAPHAYTNAYSPRFIIPEDLGPHVIKGEEIEAEYAPDTGTSATYPPRPYKYRVDADIPKVNLADPQTATITISGTATKTEETETPVNTSNTYMTWGSHGEQIIGNRPLFAHYNMPFPRGIHTWQYSNFGSTIFGTGSENWITPGLWDKAVLGAEWNPITVEYVQVALNLAKYWAFYEGPAGYLSETGTFDKPTKTNLINFQTNFQCKDRSGRVNVETISTLSSQMLRLDKFLRANGKSFDPQWAFNKPRRFIFDAPQLCHLRNISDGNENTAWIKGTSVKEASRTPSSAWDYVALRIPGNHNISKVSIIPYMRFKLPDMLWTSIHVTTTTDHNDLVNYMYKYQPGTKGAQMVNMNRRPKDGVRDTVAIGPIQGNTVIIGIGQDQQHNTSFIFGLKEFGFFAESTSGGVTNTNTTTESISYSEEVTINPGDPAVLITPQLQSDPSLYSSIVWDNVSSSNSNISATIIDTVSGKAEARNTEVDVYDEIHQSGKVYPDSFTSGNYGYSKNKLGNVSAFPESGFISKADGLKIFCDKDGNPNWEMPIPIASSETETEIQQYTEYTLVPLDNDPMVTIGFYDVNTNSFIFGSDGKSRIVLGELDERGRENVFVAAASAYQELKEMALPDADPAKLPYKWAMPTYGICEKITSRIGIEPISPGLGKLDIWPIGIRTGKFARDIYIRDNFEGPLTNWIAEFRGKTVRAFYSIPEMDKAGWSPLLGRPFIDIIDESPIIVDNNKIKVRQPPIAMEHEIMHSDGTYRPVRPFLKVYVRASAEDPWTIVPWEGILDYKISEGTVILRGVIPGGQTEENVKVSYSTRTEIFPFKFSEGHRINLNPYSSAEESYVNKPTYVYIVPKIVMGPDGEIVTESVQTNTLRFTNDSSIFSPTHPEYNPLVITLGVVYVNNGSDIEKLILLDTRKKGGGVTEELDPEEAFSTHPESFNFWDVSPGSGLAYQEGGFIIIRLPEDLKLQFSGEDPTKRIKSIIEQRLPAGVSFKLQNLDGSDWED